MVTSKTFGQRMISTQWTAWSNLGSPLTRQGALCCYDNRGGCYGLPFTLYSLYKVIFCWCPPRWDLPSTAVNAYYNPSFNQFGESMCLKRHIFIYTYSYAYNHHHTQHIYNEHHLTQPLPHSASYTKRAHLYVCTFVNAWLVKEKHHQCKLQQEWHHGWKLRVHISKAILSLYIVHYNEWVVVHL